MRLRLIGSGLLLSFACVSAHADGLITSTAYGTIAEGGAYTVIDGMPVSDVYASMADSSAMNMIGLGSAGVPGANAGSYASLADHTITSYAFADTYGFARGLSAMWDTLWFSGTSPGDFISFILNASIDTDGIDNSWAYAFLRITVGNGTDYGFTQLITNGPLVGPASISITFPLKDGPLQYVAENQSWATASTEAGVPSSHTIIDPSISLVVPDGVTFYSESGVEYPTTPTGVTPEPSSLSLLALATAVIARKLRNKPSSSETCRD